MQPSGLASTELYNPAAGTWSAAAPLGTARSNHRATLLPNGKVLIAGGASGGIALASAELYDPATDTWSATGALATARYNYTATLLPDGRVLAVGGIAGSVFHASAELYDPASGTWSPTAALAASRALQSSTLLPNGRVLIAGGYNSAGLTAPELSDSRLGFGAATQPQVNAASINGAGKLVLTGAGFRGISGASGGTTQDSATNYPIVQLRRLDNDETTFLRSDAATNVSATAFTSVAVPAFPGHALVTVFANGIPSTSAIIAMPVAPVPDIVIEQPVGTVIPVNGTKSFGTVVQGSTTSLTFTIRNPGTANLTGLAITKDGANAGEFTVTANPTAPVAGGGSTTFTVQWLAATGATGTRTAALHIANNVTGKNPYHVTLTGHSLGATTDTDSDGMNDAAEYLLAPLGFDWQASQTTLVNTYYTHANAAGLYTQTQYDASRQAGRDDVTSAPNSYGLFTLAQVQALNVGAPLLSRDAVTGKFTLTLALKKSADLATYQPFPFTDPGTTINGQGQLEFEFAAPGNAAFFRVEAR
jgi:hypothetical protein